MKIWKQIQKKPDLWNNCTIATDDKGKVVPIISNKAYKFINISSGGELTVEEAIEILKRKNI